MYNSETPHATSPAPGPSPTPVAVRDARSRSARIGRALLVIVAVLTIVAPVLLDAVVFAGEHMQNPAWPPHAKLHTAILFLFGIAVGGAALVCLLARPVTDRFSMTMGAFLATAFWFALSAAGFWPGTSWSAGNDPEPYPLGLPPNVAMSLLLVAVAVVGLTLVLKPSGQAATGWWARHQLQTATHSASQAPPTSQPASTSLNQ